MSVGPAQQVVLRVLVPVAGMVALQVLTMAVAVAAQRIFEWVAPR
jgi:hypothetical protein